MNAFIVIIHKARNRYLTTEHNKNSTLYTRRNQKRDNMTKQEMVDIQVPLYAAAAFALDAGFERGFAADP
jgi:hypothetical protein